MQKYYNATDARQGGVFAGTSARSAQRERNTQVLFYMYILRRQRGQCNVKKAVVTLPTDCGRSAGRLWGFAGQQFKSQKFSGLQISSS